MQIVKEEALKDSVLCKEKDITAILDDIENYIIKKLYR